MSMTGKAIILSKDARATLVPSGHHIELKAGTPVRVMQAKAGNYTVEVFGNRVVLGPESYDAMGVDDTDVPQVDQSAPLEEQVNFQLSQCYDPEIPVNIVDLGLIYNINLTKQGQVVIDMTLTSPTCGMGPFIVDEVKRRLLLLEALTVVEVNVVFDPPWQRGMMSQSAKLTLGVL